MPPRKTPEPPPAEPHGTNDRAKTIWAGVGAGLLAMVVLTALYGSEVKSARAFRLLTMWTAQ